MGMIVTTMSNMARKLFRAQYDSLQNVPMHSTTGGELITAKGLPDFTELVRQGDSWFGKGVVTSVTLGQVLPTTLAASTLWNGNPVGGKSLVLDGVGFWGDVSAGAASFFQLYIAPSVTPVSSAPATAEAGVIRSLRLGKSYGGRAIISQNADVVDTGWIPLHPSFNTAAITGTVGVGHYVKLDGLFIIPPQYYIGLHASSTNTTSELGFYYIWHELQLNLP
jgi:hypothetical protein